LGLAKLRFALRKTKLFLRQKQQLVCILPEGELYSCFEKGCLTKPYATMPKGIMVNGDSLSLVEVLGVSATWRQTAQANVLMLSLFLLGNTVNLNQSTPNSFYPNTIVAYAFTLLWDNFCRNSCMQNKRDVEFLAFQKEI